MVDNTQKALRGILDKYKLIKDINLNEGIDNENSAYYRIDSLSGGLRLSMSKAKAVGIQDCRRVFGGLSPEKYGFKIKPSVNEEFGDMSYVNSSLFVERDMIKNKEDMIHLKTEWASGSYLYFRLCNKYFRNIMRKILNGDVRYGKDAFADNRSRTLDFVFSDNGLNIVQRCGIEIQKENTTLIPIMSNNVDMYINFNHKYLLINNEKIRIQILNSIDNDYTDINIISFMKQEKYLGEAAVINELAYGEKEGYIYFKDILLEGRMANVFMIYNGNPELQYYKESSHCWQAIGKNQTVDAGKALRLRIRMGTEDQLFKLLITETE